MPEAVRRDLRLRSGDAEQEVSVRLFWPVEDAKAWDCRWEINWPDRQRANSGRGVDAIQALLHALEMIGAEIYTSEEHRSGRLVWSDGWKGSDFQCQGAFAICWWATTRSFSEQRVGRISVSVIRRRPIGAIRFAIAPYELFGVCCMCERFGVERMKDRLELLAEIMDEVEECLSLALEMKDRETVARMTEVADDLARCARRTLALHVVAGSSRRKLHS